MDVSCAFVPGRPGEVEDRLFFEPPSRGFPGIEKGALIEIVKGVFGLPDSPRAWWKELRDTLQGDSWTSLKLDPALFCLRDFSGHLTGMIIVHVEESHFSRLLSKYDIKDVKMADDDGGVLYCGKRVRTLVDDMKPGCLSLRQDQTEFVKARCEPARFASSPSLTRGSPVYNKRNSRDAKYDREFALGNGRNTSGRVIRDQSVAEETISALGVRSQARRTNYKTLEGPRNPLPTKMCVLACTDSALHNADADTDDEGSDDEWLTKAKQKGIRVRSQHGALVCVVDQDDLEKTEAIPISFMTWKSKASKRTILSTFGAEASACRDALDLNTREQCCVRC